MSTQKKGNSISEAYKQAVSTCAHAMRAGQTILYPTDTVWGLGCDATNPEAVQAVFDLKQRKPDKSLIILVNGPQLLNRYLREIPDAAWDIFEYAEKPTTLILPNAAGLAPGVCAEDGSVGVRWVKSGFAFDLLHRTNKPLISTSANLAGEPTPILPAEIHAEIIKNVGHQVPFDVENKSSKKPSALIKLDMDGGVKILRQ